MEAEKIESRVEKAEEEDPFPPLGSGEVATGTIQGLLSEGVLNKLTSYQSLSGHRNRTGQNKKGQRL
jgi:hypothetical protein